MSPAVVLVILIVAALFLLALRYSIKHAGKCGDCDGTKCGTCSALNEMALDLQKRGADKTGEETRITE